MGKSCKTPRQHDSDKRERAEVNAQSSLPVDTTPLAQLSIAVKTDINSWELHDPAQPRPVLQLTPGNVSRYLHELMGATKWPNEL